MSVQPGFGNLGKLPLEIRRMIWGYFTPPDEKASGLRGSPLRDRSWCKEGAAATFTPTSRQDLAIIRTSMAIHDEITQQLYRNRTLNLCLCHEGHWFTWVAGGYQGHYAPFGTWSHREDGRGCDYTLRYFTLSKNTSLRLNLRFSSWHHNFHEFENFQTMINVIRDATQVSCLKVDITLDIHPPCPDCYLDGTVVSIVQLEDIALMLRSLVCIKHLSISSVEIGFALFDGQNWLAEVIHRIVRWGQDFPRFDDWGDYVSERVTKPLDLQHDLHESVSIKPTTAKAHDTMNVMVWHRNRKEEASKFLPADFNEWGGDPDIVTKLTFT